MNEALQVESRRAIEALRAGVPNRDAVRELGCTQAKIEEEFLRRLDETRDGLAQGRQAPGLLVGGDFGAGKSHLFEYLRNVALEKNFVCSKVVVSKETPFYDAFKLYRAAIGSAMVPGKKGSALREICLKLDPGRESYRNFWDWANQTKDHLDNRFPATLFLFERSGVYDQELCDRIVSDWSGDPMPLGEIKRKLRDFGEATAYGLRRVRKADLALQYFRFAPRLMTAAGYSGWVILIDELELIGRYSLLQRGKSYAELARWAGKIEEESRPGLFMVFAITPDFEAEVLDRSPGRNDLETVPKRLRARGSDRDILLAARAERGMGMIREILLLERPDNATIDATREKVRRLYSEAHGWEPPAGPEEEKLLSASMRQYVKRWITRWDLERLYPGHKVEIEETEIESRYVEDVDLERSTEDKGNNSG